MANAILAVPTFFTRTRNMLRKQQVMKSGYIAFNIRLRLITALNFLVNEIKVNDLF